MNLFTGNEAAVFEVLRCKMQIVLDSADDDSSYMIPRTHASFLLDVAIRAVRDVKGDSAIPEAVVALAEDLRHGESLEYVPVSFFEFALLESLYVDYIDGQGGQPNVFH